ncbi:MAG: hypothetical protein ACI9YT_002843 [Halobacteriales archaeon]|jgi:hypothetical protein
MGDMEEDRVYDAPSGEETVYVANDLGVGTASVSLASGRVGRFSLDRQCGARDLAAADGWVAVATDEDVIVRTPGGEYVDSGFGPADAVGFDRGPPLDLLAASPAAEIGRVVDLPEDPSEWLEIADVDAPVRAIEGPFVAAADGVYRASPDSLNDTGLEDTRDVSTPGVPLVATADGLYRLGAGWMVELDEPTDAVAAAPPVEDGTLGRAFAVVDGRLQEHDPDADDWHERSIPEGPVVDVAFGEHAYAVTATGTLLVGAGDGWEYRSIGLADPVGVSVP